MVCRRWREYSIAWSPEFFDSRLFTLSRLYGLVRSEFVFVGVAEGRYQLFMKSLRLRVFCQLCNGACFCYIDL